MRFNARSATAIFLMLYAAVYGAFGVASPFWPRFFETRGLSSQELGILLGLGTLIRLISGPLVGRLADAFGKLRTALAACIALAAALALALLLANAFWSLLIIHLLQMAALAPVTTTADALATSGAQRNPPAGFVYGRIRGTASAAFVAGTLTAGVLLSGAAVSIVFLHAALLAAAAGAALLLPEADVPPRRQTMSLASFTGGVCELWASVIFRRVVVVAALVYGSHAVHDAFAVIRSNEAGIGPAMASVLWSEAVAAEVVMFFLIGPALVNRLGTNGAAALAAAAGVVRWCVAGTTTSTIALAMVQPLHGFTFALLHLTCMRLSALVVPARLAATGQALYALGAGTMSAVLTMLSGQLYATLAGAAFLPMALLCLLALPLAWTGLRQPTDSTVQARVKTS
jgi:MFS transporter, PPP family, 3-phenylpropionic acid transporter